MSGRLSTQPWWRGIPPGATVYYTTPQGQSGKGKVVMALPTHVVTRVKNSPVVVNERNYVKHTVPRKKS